MATKKIEIQDSNGNVYYPHTEASVVKNGSKTVAEQLNDIMNERGYTNTKIITGLDLNDFSQSGIFAGTKLIHSPQDNVWFVIEVFNIDQYAIQRAMGFADGGIRTFERRKNLGTWSEWKQLVTIDKAVNNLTTNQEGFALDARQGKALYDMFNKIKYMTFVIDPQGANSVVITTPNTIDRANIFIIAQNGDPNVWGGWVTGTQNLNATTIRVGLNENRTGNIRINLIYRSI